MTPNYTSPRDAVCDILTALRLKRKLAVKGLSQREEAALARLIERLRPIDGAQFLDVMLAYKGLGRDFR